MGLSSDWWRAGLTWRTGALLPISWIYRATLAARRLLYGSGVMRTERLPVPVVVVGNLIVGGSGKTPLVIALVEALQDAGMRPGVISRGFGRAGEGILEIDETTPPALSGDEPLLIRRRTGMPVVVGRDRVAAAHALLAAHAEVDVIVADDGLQHLRLGRDIGIAVFDDRTAGNGQLLPAGPLREPLTCLAHVDAVVMNGDTRASFAATAMRLAQLPLHRLRAPAETCELARFADAHGPRVAAVAGIGNPGRFFTALAAAGINAAPHPFPDHHAYVEAELAAIDADAIVMTEKDALKCELFADSRLWVAPVAAILDIEFVDMVLEKVLGRKAA
jgi:tetraacyldisaccharide 4'-kinase